MSNPENQKKHRERVKEKGRKINEENRPKDLLLNPDPIEFKKFVVVRIPFDTAISKNRSYGRSHDGRLYLRPEGKAVRDRIYYTVKAAMNSGAIKFHLGKVWVDIFVEKSNHLSDAINVVDAVCDSVKKAIDVDDRWFSIRRLDWAIVKEKPVMTIKVGQETNEEMALCSSCGRMLLVACFIGDVRKDNKCKECKSPKQTHKDKRSKRQSPITIT